jgi:hypothetical protein
MQQDSSHPTGISTEGKTQPEAVRARQRKANAAYRMALSGANWKQIARVCGYPTERAAKVAVELMLEKRIDPSDKQHLRLMVSGRLDTLLRGIWAKATDQDSPEQLTAVQRVREIVADYRKVWGIDAPQEVIVTSPTQRDIDEFVASVVRGTLPPVENADIVDADIIGETEQFEPGDADAV